MHNTLAITMIKSGQAANVIPGEAEAIINARLLPGATTDQLIEEVKRVVHDDSVSVDFATPVSQEATRKYYQAKSNIPESSTDTELYRALRTHAAAVWPQAQLVPVLFEAGTDAVAWRERGVPVYGIYPYPLDADVLKGMHGHDERIAVRSLYEGTDWVYRVLLDVAKK
jgi:acetylornithine deacetylase/succinyl-diaminopimelate desuccinylase-like protein